MNQEISRRISFLGFMTTCGIVLYHCGPYKYRGCYYSTRGGKIKG